ncbi:MULTISPECIES: SDR family oxidoreductase [Arthrobacter]|uniref:SDR family oxidoreductase n=1 Tax=Arthrobacter caoxuetaonis TaxID=2886935 RepID=A0A9X1MGZ8_9MICC|nr:MULTISPECIES: SDR family oxidoreductase [Arthrobacter]MCC3283818.1 SDR family oxidoreductase [Arthrobacter caoxuetaonis]MCC3299040.1 SDR family oxidoreductase [Arthrobacter caoxuetaonis]MCC9193256.1 SDR family oxidoreductase [Arthrobacter sp. zg-Y916]USQ58620.1 SDR family oxidoreductase [Arthrobacter caoxuetaonis]
MSAAGAGEASALEGLRVLVAGAASASGTAVCTALARAGAQVIAVGSSAGRLDESLGLVAGVELRTCDLSRPGDVASLASDMQGYGGIDGLIHLVGGWRGGGTLEDQSDDDWDFLQQNIMTTLRNVSRSFVGQLAASEHGRLAIVSSTAVESPTPGNAGYAAAKAAAEAWVQAIAAQFSGTGAAAVVFVVKALVNDAMRAGQPERKFPGYTDVSELARAATSLFTAPAGQINGKRINLVPRS